MVKRVRLPKSFALQSEGRDEMSIIVTMMTTADVDAVIRALTIMRNTLTSRRDMVADDIGVPEPKPILDGAADWHPLP